MPLLKPSTPPKKNTKPAGKTLPPKKGGPPRNKRAPRNDAYALREPSWWENLSAERKLDVVGIILAFIGIIIFLGLISANRSALIGGAIFFLSQIFGWGVYILPLGLLLFGLWLVFRKIERIPPLTLERTVGSLILFLWLLTVIHSFAATAQSAEAVALAGAGGGALGGLFKRILWAGLGGGGTFVALLAWLIISIAITLDKPVSELFFWLAPLTVKLRELLNKPIASPLEPASAATDDFTPIDASALPQ
ncbi:MAG: DNA translocase FtsK 4TM domain-containing protein, partial [Anaerolineales bacterium]|nr:DNA translocase FtsK 4TM domain-containing protein [Anaerolineales bacterium]